MPIHTAEISLPPFTDANQAARLMNLFHIPQYKIARVMNIKPDHQKALASHKLSRDYPNLGIKKVVLFRDADSPITMGLGFFLKLKIEPQMMLEGRRTIKLFCSTPENIAALEDSFHDAITHFISYEEFPDFVRLPYWNCNRIDYTRNIRFEAEEDANLFLRLSKRTSRYLRRRPVQLDRPDPEQSTAEINKSSKVIFYKKKKQIQEVYEGIPQEDMQRLLDDAEGLIRYEVQCKGGKVSSLMKSRNFESRSIINFLNEGLANDILYKSYCETIGPGDFMYLYMMEKVIKKSGYGTRLKNSLIKMEHLIAQSRSIAQGKVNFIGGDYNVKGLGIVGGTEVTFRSHLDKMAGININPYPIPKDWVKRKEKILANPIDQIRQNEVVNTINIS